MVRWKTLGSAIPDEGYSILMEYTLSQHSTLAHRDNPRLEFIRKGCNERIIHIQDGEIFYVLVLEYTRLGIDILLKVCIPVQMVLSQIQQHRYLGAKGDNPFQLERTDFRDYQVSALP
jgi:hypothetical protein